MAVTKLRRRGGLRVTSSAPQVRRRSSEPLLPGDRSGVTSTPPPSRRAAILATLVLALLPAWGCGDNPGTPVANRPPSVRITGGPVEGSRSSYTARIYWSGWDYDGIITNYEYAVDPPGEFSPEEISDPEHSPGVRTLLLLGPSPAQDTLVVSKTVDGEVRSFRWVETPEFSRSFSFATDHPDSLPLGGIISPVSSYSGAHRVYVRARDNEGASSPADAIGYTATTITPSSRIEQPDASAEISNLGQVLTVRWDGVDPDGADAGHRPTGYLFKLLRLDTLDPKVTILAVSNPSILFTRGGDWTYQSADTLQRIIPLGTPGQYVFGVRAVDEAGGVEPFLQFGRNAFKFIALPNGGRPILTLGETTVGSFTFRGVGQSAEVEVPSGHRLLFTWNASAGDYGGTIDAYSWGVDIPDLDREGPDSGWSPWGTTLGNRPAIVFNRSGIHVLYVRVRDVAGALTLATVVMHVIEFSFDREVLLVDDTLDGTYPRDSQHDAFWRDQFAAYGGYDPGQVVTFDVFGAGDLEAISPVAPTLSDIGRYKLVVWECNGSGYNSVGGLFLSTVVHPILQGYLGTGGKLWLGGRTTVAATTAADNGTNADLTYPKAPVPGQFAYDFLKLHSTKINNDKGKEQKNSIVRAIPFPGRPEIYPQLDVDPAKLNGYQQGAVAADAIFDPMYDESEVSPPFRGDVDSLYTYGAAGSILGGTGSTYQNRLTAIRWHDPDPDRMQGRIQWFGFPLYYMKNDQVQVTFRRSLDWFREETLATGASAPGSERRSTKEAR